MYRYLVSRRLRPCVMNQDLDPRVVVTYGPTLASEFGPAFLISSYPLAALSPELIVAPNQASTSIIIVSMH